MQLERGQRTVEVLKQGQFQPVQVDEQVTVIYAVTNGYTDEVPVSSILRWEAEFLRFMRSAHPEIGKKITDSKQLDDATEKDLKAAIEQFKKQIAA